MRIERGDNGCKIVKYDSVFKSLFLEGVDNIIN